MEEEKERRLQNIINARAKYSQLSLNEVDKLRKRKARNVQKEVEGLQQVEMKQIEEELERLRNEYRWVCNERGNAHKAAKLIEAQEADMRRFEERRQFVVRSRAERVAKDKERKWQEEEANQREEKEKKLQQRRQLFDKRKGKENRGSKERKGVESELRKLQQLETLLKEKIAAKRRGDSHSETSIEKAVERVFWPLNPLPNWEFLDEDASLGSFEGTRRESTQIQTKDFGGQTSQVEATALATHSSVTSSLDIPHFIARRAIEKLTSQKVANVRQMPSVETKLYRDMAINTSLETRSVHVRHRPPPAPVESEAFSPRSTETSYWSLPTKNIESEKLKNLVKLFKERAVTNEANITVREESLQPSPDGSLEDLLVRIEKIKASIEKEAIDPQVTVPKKVYESDPHRFVPHDLSTIAESESDLGSGDKGEKRVAASFCGVQPEVFAPEAGPSRTSDAHLHLSSSTSSSSSSLSSVSLTRREEALLNKQSRSTFWKDVFDLAGVPFTESAREVIKQTTRHEMSSFSMPSSLTIQSSASHSISAASGLKHSTPKQGSVISSTARVNEEPDLTFIETVTEK